MSIEQAIGYAVNQAVTRLKPKAPKSPPARAVESSEQSKNSPQAVFSSEQSHQSPPAVEEGTKPASTKRNIPAELKRQVWQRDQGRCTFQDKQTGRRCGSRYALEYDHERPHALGGATTAANLRLRCRVHNQLAALEAFGARKMARFVPAMR